ncbi:homogentisate phytyltransferase 1 [Citrus sinensis]|nr:homogentisate phytyltransferase 1 [Citrus sinensis]
MAWYTKEKAKSILSNAPPKQAPRKVNKPHLPLASGDFSIGEGVAIAVISTMTSVAMGIMLRSPPLFIGLITWWIVGAAYSIDLPLLRWKGSPLMAAVTIMILNGLLLQFPYFVHVQDLPDVEGDKEFGLRTLPVILGKEKVFSISVSMLLMAYGAAILTGASSPFLLCKLVTMIGHSVLGFILWHQTRTIDLSDAKSMQSLYMFIFKLYYAEFFLIHFIR